jgi:hypothetical protein
VALANQDGGRIDGFDDIKIVDRDAYLTSLDKATKGSFGSDALRPRDARCIATQIRRNATNAELERSVTSGDKSFAFEAVNFCLGGGIDLIAITQLIDNQLVHEGIDPGTAQCLAGIAIAGQKLGKGSASLEQFATSQKVQDNIAKAIKQGAFICAGQ